MKSLKKEITKMRIINICTFFALFVLANPAYAVVIYDNFGPNDSSSFSGGPSLGLIGIGSVDTGAAFTPIGSSYIFETITFRVSIFTGPQNLDLWLMSDISGEPGTIIEAFNFSGFSSDFALLTATSSGSVTLLEDAQYWVVASLTGPGASGYWNANSIQDFGPEAQRVDQGSWSVAPNNPTRPVFRVTGQLLGTNPDPAPNPVPEPSTFTLLGFGIVSLGFMLGRRRYGF